MERDVNTRAVNSSKSVDALLQLVMSAERRFKWSNNSYLDSAVREINRFRIQDSDSGSLLRSARTKLDRAVVAEVKNPIRLSIAYIELAFVHETLGDHESAIQALQELVGLRLRPSVSKVALAFVADITVLHWFDPMKSKTTANPIGPSIAVRRVMRSHADAFMIRQRARAVLDEWQVT